MACQLGKYLVGRGDIFRFRTFAPTKKDRFLLRNLETAEGIQKGFGASDLEMYQPDLLTIKFGDYVPADSKRIPEFVENLRQLDGRIVVLNAGILEGIVRSCGGNVEEFGHCGYGRLTIPLAKSVFIVPRDIAKNIEKSIKKVKAKVVTLEIELPNKYFLLAVIKNLKDLGKFLNDCVCKVSCTSML